MKKNQLITTDLILGAVSCGRLELTSGRIEDRCRSPSVYAGNTSLLVSMCLWVFQTFLFFSREHDLVKKKEKKKRSYVLFSLTEFSAFNIIFIVLIAFSVASEMT